MVIFCVLFIKINDYGIFIFMLFTFSCNLSQLLKKKKVILLMFKYKGKTQRIFVQEKLFLMRYYLFILMF